jgi:hypothetical protein
MVQSRLYCRCPPRRTRLARQPAQRARREAGRPERRQQARPRGRAQRPTAKPGIRLVAQRLRIVPGTTARLAILRPAWIRREWLFRGARKINGQRLLAALLIAFALMSKPRLGDSLGRDFCVGTAFGPFLHRLELLARNVICNTPLRRPLDARS